MDAKLSRGTLLRRQPPVRPSEIQEDKVWKVSTEFCCIPDHVGSLAKFGKAGKYTSLSGSRPQHYSNWKPLLLQMVKCTRRGTPNVYSASDPEPRAGAWRTLPLANVHEGTHRERIEFYVRWVGIFMFQKAEVLRVFNLCLDILIFEGRIVYMFW